uniref:SJCHGC03562 protein n=1 Tax=Schistosoma japonicum TaxID=6182 RepID=Q5DCX8_SCHJA|nr:SJCHGC03562 protein [Schistosoma japonicum]
MEVGSKTENIESYDETPLVHPRRLPKPVVPSLCTKPLFHNIPVLTTGSGNEIWKLRVQTILEGCTSRKCVGQIMMALSDDIVRRVTAAGFPNLGKLNLLGGC